MTTDPRLEALVEKAMGILKVTEDPHFESYLGTLEILLRAILSEAMTPMVPKGTQAEVERWIAEQPSAADVIRAIQQEAMEAGAWVTCQECGAFGYTKVPGEKIESYGDGGSGVAQPIARKTKNKECSTCLGTGRIRRELAGALWAADEHTSRGQASPEWIRSEAREKWGEKQEAAASTHADP